MACMCGDICCWSCGPAQGNWKCPICRTWASEGCAHVTDDGQDIKPEFHAEVQRLALMELAAEEQLVGDLQAEAALAERYWNELSSGRES